MKLGIFEPEMYAQTIRNSLAYSGIDTVPITDTIPDVDGVLVCGGDRGVRMYFNKVDASSVPVLGLSEGETAGFLTQIDIKNLESYSARLRRGDYSIEEIPRLEVKIDQKKTHAVLNDATVVSSRSAMLMEYTLWVNEQEVWHDNSDGVIVCTPLGSTAYCMSAGGPMIFQGSSVFGIVSINSLDNTRRPLIVSDDSTVIIDEISSRTHCEVVLDGIDRSSVRKSVECSALEHPARIMRMQNDITSISALAKKVHLAEDLLSMPPSSKLLLKTLEYEGVMTQRELAARTMLPDRTVRMALTHLLQKGYVSKKVSMRDARQRIYQISGAVSRQSRGRGHKG